MNESTPDRVNWNRFARLIRFSIILVIVFVLLSFFYRSILFAIFFSFFLTYLLRKPFSYIDRNTIGPRSLKAFLVVCLLVIVFSLMVSYLFPLIYVQMVQIAVRLPVALQYLLSEIDPFKEALVSWGYFDINSLNHFIEGLNIVDQVSMQIKTTFQNLMTSTPTLMEGILNLGLVPVFTFFTLANYLSIKKVSVEIIPADLIRPLKRLRKKIDRTLMSVIQGQITVALILVVFYMVGFSFVSLKFAIAIGAVAGICRIVPYLDVIVGLSLSMVVIITQPNQNIEQIIGVGAVFLVVQLIDGMIITPRVIGESTGLHPAIVIASIFAFGDWFGFIGVLLAVPTVAILKSIIECLWPYYLKSPYYHAINHK